MGEPEIVSFKEPLKKRPSRRGKSKISEEVLSSFVAMGFGLYGMSRPFPLQRAWEITPDDAKGVAGPLAESLSGLPDHVMEMAANVINPLAAGVAFVSLFAACKMREELIVEQIRRQNGNGGANPASAGNGAQNGYRASEGEQSPSAPEPGPSKPSDLNFE